VNIRPATPNDAQALADVSSATYKSTYTGMFSKDSWLDFATPGYFHSIWEKDLVPATSEGAVLVSEDSGKIVGFIATKAIGERGDAYEELAPGAFFELKELYVLKDYQFSKQKIGTHLLHEAIKDLAEDKMIVGHAARRNENLRKYMASLGAEERESGTIILFKHATDGEPWEIKTGRVSFYWKVPVLREALEAKLAKAS